MNIETFTLGSQRPPVKDNALIEELQNILNQDQEQFIEILNADRKRSFKTENPHPHKFTLKANILKDTNFLRTNVAVLSGGNGLLDIRDPEQCLTQMPSENEPYYAPLIEKHGVFSHKKQVPSSQLAPHLVNGAISFKTLTNHSSNLGL